MISTTQDDLINRTEPTLFERLFHYPSLFLGYICVNVFGRRLMFPGSLQLLRQMMERPLLDGRTNLIVQHRAKRYLIHTADGNNIDTIFVDRRQSNTTRNGQTLVITCEGNAGFYETGCMLTPIEAGYSVLGWNRPGFGESSVRYRTVFCKTRCVEGITLLSRLISVYLFFRAILVHFQKSIQLMP
jgi:hypothetical protein